MKMMKWRNCWKEADADGFPIHTFSLHAPNFPLRCEAGGSCGCFYPEPETHEREMGWETISAASVAGADCPGSFWNRKSRWKASIPECLYRDTKEEREVRTGSGHRTVSSLWGWRGKRGGIWLRQ